MCVLLVVRVCCVTLLRGGGGDSWLAEAVFLSLRELRRRLGRVLPWSQLQKAGETDKMTGCPLINFYLYPELNFFTQTMSK